VYWNADNARFTAWTPSADPAAQAMRLPAYVTEVDFVFDRRLDGNRIEDSVSDGGVSVPVSKAIPPITVQSPPGLVLQVLYNSLPLLGGDSSSYVLAQPQPSGVPSGSTIVFALDHSNLTSVYGEPMLTPDTVAIPTEDFTVQPVLPGGARDGGPPTVGATYQLPLQFSNRPADAATVAPFMHARAGGVDLPVALASDPSMPTFLYLGPAACAVAWPAGATVDVTIDAGLPDAFGVPLAAGAAATFVVGAGGTPASDGGCAPSDAGS
jgi:hypothetical protein